MRALAFLVALPLTLAGCLFFHTPTPDDLDTPQNATFADLVAGKFPSALDRAGTNGVVVTVRNVTVTEVDLVKSDGDWHLNSTDATYSPFVMEVIPRDQAVVGQPPTNVPLQVWGVPYCDAHNAREAYHGFTCWEVHPVLRWQREP